MKCSRWVKWNCNDLSAFENRLRACRVRRISSLGEEKVYGGKGLPKSQVLSSEWKNERVREDESGESEDDEDELPCVIGDNYKRDGDSIWRGSNAGISDVLRNCAYCTVYRHSTSAASVTTDRTADVIVGVVVVEETRSALQTLLTSAGRAGDTIFLYIHSPDVAFSAISSRRSEILWP